MNLDIQKNSQLLAIIAGIVTTVIITSLYSLIGSSESSAPLGTEVSIETPLATSTTEIENATSTIVAETEDVTPQKPTAVDTTTPEVVIPVAVTPEPVVITQTGLTSAQRSTLLVRHNTVRSQKDLLPLTWSASVAASAQTWADTLGNRGCVLEHSSGPYGENLYYSWTTGALVLNPSEAVTWWLAEEQYYDYDTNSCEAGEQCGHYTQAVWADTTTVGCGVTTCTDNGRNTQLWVCQYSPPGNVGSQKPY